MEELIELLSNSKFLYIVSMIICLLFFLYHTYNESENITHKSDVDTLYSITTLLLISFVPIINIVVASILTLIFIVYFLGIIFNMLKKLN